MTIQSSPKMFSAADGLAGSLSDLILLVARLGMSWLFLSGGWAKLNNMTGTVAYMNSLGAPSPELLYWPAMVVELAIGVGLILGLATRYSALLMVVFTVLATYIAHRYWTYPAAQAGGQAIHFWKNAVIIGGALTLFVTGAGRYSLDAILSKRQ